MERESARTVMERRHGELGRLFSGTPKYFAERCDSMIATASSRNDREKAATAQPEA